MGICVVGHGQQNLSSDTENLSVEMMVPVNSTSTPVSWGSSGSVCPDATFVQLQGFIKVAASPLAAVGPEREEDSHGGTSVALLGSPSQGSLG